ncbi:MAG: hypothetical protein GOMPHAMPRED_007843 [Gomphillus americanus]|uniref:Uncharacterized protein n=1 Tax=Gomphillus americanus TaxID=1940652 RepID=A0A8H3EZR3_9LECA|nr:MAG: hypothetical protein GOMPHAMPRED_007843 [Gomphillus americanus]
MPVKSKDIVSKLLDDEVAIDLIRGKASLSAEDFNEQLGLLQKLVEPFLDPIQKHFIPRDFTIIWILTFRVLIHAIPIVDIDHIRQKSSLKVPTSREWRTVINPLPSHYESSASAKGIAELLIKATALYGENITKQEALEAELRHPQLPRAR